MAMTVNIKNMVCRHCVAAVTEAVHRLGLPATDVRLGSIEFARDLTPQELEALEQALAADGFDIIQTREAEAVERIKHTLIELSRRDTEKRPQLADEVSRAAGMSYSSAGRLFSQVEGRTIENYFLALRIERVKELIRYERLTLSEIALRTGFSSVAHLSRQFKQMTGMTPSQFRENGVRTPLPEV